MPSETAEQVKAAAAAAEAAKTKEESKGKPAEPDPKAKEEGKEAEGKTLKLMVGEREYELTQEQVEQALAQGSRLSQHFQRLVKEGKLTEEGEIIAPKAKRRKDDDDEEELTEEQKQAKELKELRDEVRSLRTEKNTEKTLAQVNGLLARLGPKFELTKEDEDIREDVEATVIAAWYMDPRMDISQTYKDAVKKKEKYLNKHKTKYYEEKVKKMEHKGDIPGGSDAFALDKPFSPAQLKNGDIAEEIKKRLKLG